jgi:hypothetical protein
MHAIDLSGRTAFGSRFLPIAALITLTLSISACEKFEREYSYTRATPAADRKSPTTFTVRIKLDTERRIVDWLEDVRDTEGYLGRAIKQYTDCQIFDRSNWKCWLFERDYIEMADGKLRQYYWSENRDYKTTYPVLNFLK